jgi:hypothetical protein
LILFSKLKLRIYKLKIRLTTPKISSLGRRTLISFGNQSRFHFFQIASHYLQANRLSGYYLEFGSHQGATFRMALNILGTYTNSTYKISKFISFDSFEGMPEPSKIDRSKLFKKGMNLTSLGQFKKMIKKDLHRSIIVKGFYNKSLPNYKLPEGDRVALAYIDCDYYDSTREVLDFLSNYLTHGLILVFDDYDCYYADPLRGQRLAFSQFRVKVERNFTFVDFFKLSSGGQAYIVLEKSKMGEGIE